MPLTACVRDGMNCLISFLANLINMSHLDTNPIVPAFSEISNLSNVINANGLIGLLFDLLNGVSTVKGSVDFLQGGTAGLDEEEVDGDQLDDQPALEKEVELPAACVDAYWNDELRYG